jgi:uncharacterized damage-inducible protein DinB
MVINRNLEDVSEEESLITPEAGGSSMNWVFGHIIVNRDDVLTMLGQEPVSAEELVNRYKRGSSPTKEVTLEELRKLFAESQKRLRAGFSSKTDEDLAVTVEGSEDSLEKNLLQYYFHESYHAGELGVLRRVAGKDGAIE